MRLLDNAFAWRYGLPAHQWFLKLGLPLWILGGICATELGNAFLELDRRPYESLYEVSAAETLEEVENHGRGFYAPGYIHFLPEGNEISIYSQKLVHLRMDLAEFSGSYNRKGDAEITEDALDALDETLRIMEARQGSAVVRFSYDPWFSGRKTYEPSMEMILRHMEQVGEVLSRHANAITSVECGIFGKWGEMHGSAACTQENFNRVIDKWLEVLPESIPISVRTPGQYCGWLGIERSELASNVTVPGEKAYRVGIYDDGYLASDTDLGTYVDREAEIAWLSKQALHTVFGGEAGQAYGRQGEVQATAGYMEKEAFLTHLTYLNVDWNQKVINTLKNEVYEGRDAVYQGQSGYTYVKNHMGYRFVLRSVRVTAKNPQTKKLWIEADVENVGFANLVKPKELTVILWDRDADRQFVFRGDALFDNGREADGGDPAKWNSRETTTLRMALPIDETIPTGSYKIYLRIASNDDPKEGYAIQFANEGSNVWEESLGANLLGTVEVTEAPKHLKWDIQNGITVEP